MQPILPQYPAQLLLPLSLRFPSGIFDFAIEISKNEIQVRISGCELVRGILEVKDSEIRMWMQFNRSGLGKFSESSHSSKLCVDLMDMCCEHFQVTTCYFVFPKRSSACILLVKFLGQCAGGVVERESKSDVGNFNIYDWMICRCDV